MYLIYWVTRDPLPNIFKMEVRVFLFLSPKYFKKEGAGGVYNSNALIIHGINIENAITMGSILLQIALINWSYLNRGNDARIQMKRNKMNEVLNPKDKPESRPLDSTPGSK